MDIVYRRYAGRSSRYPLGMFTQLMTTPIDIVNEYWYLLTLFLPFVHSLIVKYDAPGGTKRLISFALAAVVALASLASEPWDMITVDIVFARLAGVWAVGQTVFFAVNKALVTGSGKELNEITLPTKGIS